MKKIADRSRVFYALASALLLAMCMSVLFYSGPYRPFIRNSVGDVLAVVFLYFLLGVVRPGSTVLRAVATGAVACAIESAQLVGITPQDAPPPVQLIVGSHFDPWDLLAYTAGLILAVAADLSLAVYRRRQISRRDENNRQR